MIRDGILMLVGAFAISAFLMGFLLMVVGPKDHTHPTTGIQDGTQVCVVGEGAVDYDITTTRPFLLCGSINLFEEEEVDPPLGSDAHLVQ